MKIKNVLECERDQLEKITKYQLANKFLGIGFWVFGLSFVSMIILKFFDFNKETITMVLRNLMMISLLVVSLSKDKEEDEMLKLIRMQSYAIAFITGVLYAVMQPAANYVVALIIDSDKPGYGALGEFQVLFFMLMIQLFVFNYLKKMR
jgi:hypothetical protein